MNESQLPSPTPNQLHGTPVAVAVQPRSSFGRKLLIIACVLFGIFGLAATAVAFWYQQNLNASPFKPVSLTAGEQKTFDEKITVINNHGQKVIPAHAQELPAPELRPYDPAKTIVFNEREINAWLQQQGLGESVKFRIRNGSISATVLAPVQDDVPVLGGHTIAVQVSFNTGLDANRKFVFSLADVNVGGISFPNDWLGNLKGVNLLTQKNGTEDPLLKAFLDGIRDFEVRNGELRIVLND